MSGETTRSYLKRILGQAGESLGFDVSQAAISVPQSAFGDYATNAALVAAKQVSQNPKAVAEKLVEKLKQFNLKDVFAEIYSSGGFINFRFSEKFLLKQLGSIIETKDEFGTSNFGKNKKILVEYFQPNIAKPLHLGHLRTAIIGDSLFRILQFEGFNTESDTHLGDWGTQFGLLILAYKKYGNDKVVAKDPIAELNKLYVKINAEAEKDPKVREQGKAEFVKLEKDDNENHKLWEQFSKWSWKEFELIYEELGVRRADHSWPESFFEDKMPKVLEELKSKHLLVESQGAQIIDLSKFNLGVALVVKSDGGTTYLLRDLATYIYRKAQGFKRQLYVVDVRQAHTLAQTFKILELMGHITTPDEAKHVAYGFLTLPEGAMSTRKGTVVGAKEFIENVQKNALAIIKEKNPTLTDKEKVAKMVAAAAIKYFDLSHNIRSDIVFDPKKAISFEGSSGPYLQYTYARIHGILRKADYVPSLKPEIKYEFSLNDYEKSLVRKLLKFPEVVAQVATDCLPNLLCVYLFELAQVFNTLYEQVTVIHEKEVAIRGFRLQLIDATAQVLKNGLYLLGIQAPEEM